MNDTVKAHNLVKDICIRNRALIERYSLTKRQHEILMFCKEHSEVTCRQVANHFSLSVQGTNTVLQRLVAKTYLSVKSDFDKSGGYYYIFTYLDPSI